jgi:tetratricopeptide (TPR) repeat protein
MLVAFSPLPAWGAEDERAPDVVVVPAIEGEAGAVEGSSALYREIPGSDAEAGATHDSGSQAEEAAPTKRSLTPEEVLSLAQALLNRGQVDEAETIYRSLLQSSSDENVRIESAFQLGQILVYRGRYREAALYFIAILNHKPDLPRVRLELARAYFLDKNYADSTFQFELVKGGDLPPAVVANVDAFLDLIRRQKNWSLDFSMNPVFDSNINQTSRTTEECVDTAIYGFAGHLCRPVDGKASGIGLNINTTLDYFKRFSQDWGIRSSVGFYAMEHKGRAFDDYSLYAALGPRYLWASGEASLQPTFRKRWYAGKEYRDEYGLRVDGRKTWDRLILDASANYTRYDYADTFLHSILQGPSWGMRLQPRYILNDRTFVQAGLEFMREDTKEIAYANDNWSYSLGAYRALPYGFSMFLEGSLTKSRYHALQWFVTKDSLIDETVRRDKILGLTATLSSNRWEKYNLTPVLRYSHTKRTSNIWSREYERNRVDFLLNLRI